MTPIETGPEPGIPHDGLHIAGLVCPDCGGYMRFRFDQHRQTSYGVDIRPTLWIECPKCEKGWGAELNVSYTTRKVADANQD